MVFVYITGSLVFLLILILIARIRIIIDTVNKKYLFRFGRIFSVYLRNIEGRYSIQLKALFISFKLKRKSGKALSEKKSNYNWIFSKRGLKHKLNFITACWKAIKIRRFHVDLDTGDYPLNAQLIALVQPINRENTQFRINFENKNQLHCVAETSIIKILWNILILFINK